VRARLGEIAAEHKLARMATLTLDPKRIPIQERERTDRYIRECWRKMRVLLARQFQGTLPFVAVLEFQKNGNAHLHVLLGRYIAQKQLSKAWQSIGGGHYVDIRFVDIHRVSAYLTAYLTGDKVLHTLELLPPRARIFTTARCIVLWGKKEKSGWWVCRVDLASLYEAAVNPSNVRFEAIKNLESIGPQLLSYFESPPLQEAIGNQDVIKMLRAAIRIWKAGVFNHGLP